MLFDKIDRNMLFYEYMTNMTKITLCRLLIYNSKQIT